MHLARRQIAMSRQVVGLYLLICLASIAWLAVGGITAARVVLSSRTADKVLSELGQLAAAVEMTLLREGPAEIQPLVERAQAKHQLAYAAVVGLDGRFVAHSLSPLCGAPVVERQGRRLRWGSVEGLRYVDELDRVLTEYRVPLAIGDQPHGTLRIAALEPDLWSAMGDVVNLAPMALLAPLSIILVGALGISRMAAPLSRIEEQLNGIARQPLDQAVSADTIDSAGVTAAGWNRIVAELKRINSQAAGETLQQRISQTLAQRRAARGFEVLESLPEGVAVTDPEGRIEFANAAINALLHGDSATIEGLWRETLGEAEAQKLLDVPAQRPLNIDVEPVRTDRVLRVARQPLVGDAVRGVVWSVRDVTQQRLADRARGQFIDTATHELRTPLANIKAYAETLATAGPGDLERQKEFCNIINAEATRLARFVDDLLSISSLEVGTLTAHRQMVDIQRLASEVADKVRPQMLQKSISFDVVLPEKLGEAGLDKDKITAMLMNLLGNAAKYTPARGRVTFKVARTDSSLVFEVQDNGVGIAAEETERVFEKFFRSSNPLVQDETGTGLGLPMAREIARLHGGDIGLTSAVGQGSTFTARVPLVKGTSR